MGNLSFGEYDEETAAQEAEEATAGGNMMKLKVGRNLLRILPPPKGQKKPFRVVYQHFIEMGPVRRSIVCSRLEARKPCEVCAFIDKLRGSKLDVDQKLAKDMFARRRVFANVIDRSDPDSGPKVIAFGKTVHEQLLGLRTDEEAGANYTHPITGHDIVIERVGTGMSDTKYTVRMGKQKPLGESDDVMQEWIDAQHDLNSYAKIPTLNEVRALLAGEDPSTAEQPAEVSPAPRGRKPRSAEDDAIDVDEE